MGLAAFNRMRREQAAREATEAESLARAKRQAADKAKRSETPPAPEVVEVLSEVQTETPLADMTVVQLRAVAKQNDVALPREATKKTDILEILLEHKEKLEAEGQEAESEQREQEGPEPEEGQGRVAE